jgi:hypothetical protein
MDVIFNLISQHSVQKMQVLLNYNTMFQCISCWIDNTILNVKLDSISGIHPNTRPEFSNACLMPGSLRFHQNLTRYTGYKRREFQTDGRRYRCVADKMYVQADRHWRSSWFLDRCTDRIANCKRQFGAVTPWAFVNSSKYYKEPAA